MPNECSFSSLQMKAMLAQDKAAFSAPQCLRHLHLKVRQVMEATWPCAYAWWDAEAHDKEAGQQFNHLPSWWWRRMEAIGQKQGRQLAELILLLFSPVPSGPAPGMAVQETRAESAQVLRESSIGSSSIFKGCVAEREKNYSHEESFDAHYVKVRWQIWKSWPKVHLISLNLTTRHCSSRQHRELSASHHTSMTST